MVFTESAIQASVPFIHVLEDRGLFAAHNARLQITRKDGWSIPGRRGQMRPTFGGSLLASREISLPAPINPPRSRAKLNPAPYFTSPVVFDHLDYDDTGIVTKKCFSKGTFRTRDPDFSPVSVVHEILEWSPESAHERYICSKCRKLAKPVENCEEDDCQYEDYLGYSWCAWRSNDQKILRYGCVCLFLPIWKRCLKTIVADNECLPADARRRRVKEIREIIDRVEKM